MRGVFTSYNPTDLVVTLSLGVVQDSLIIDPDLVPDKLKLGGILTGTGLVTFKLYSGGSRNVIDGTLIYTSSALTAPNPNFVLDVGLHGIAVLDRLKLVTTSTTGGVTLTKQYYQFY